MGLRSATDDLEYAAIKPPVRLGLHLDPREDEAPVEHVVRVLQEFHHAHSSATEQRPEEAAPRRSTRRSPACIRSDLGREAAFGVGSSNACLGSSPIAGNDSSPDGRGQLKRPAKSDAAGN